MLSKRKILRKLKSLWRRVRASVPVPARMPTAPAPTPPAPRIKAAPVRRKPFKPGWALQPPALPEIWTPKPSVIPDHLRNPDLRERLRSLAGQKVVFVPTPGNAGDSLIQAATYQVLEDTGLNPLPIGDMQDFSGHIVIIGGGGNLVPPYGAVERALLRVHETADKVIVLPQGIRAHENLLEALGPNVEIYCRDVETYAHVLEHRSRARAYLAHDMAFGIDVARLKARAESEARALIMERVARAPIEDRMAESGIRFFFRTDGERTQRIIPRSNLDLSKLFKTGTEPGQAEVGALSLLLYVDTAQEIHTDRLHVALAGVLLGKRVHMYEQFLRQIAGRLPAFAARRFSAGAVHPLTARAAPARPNRWSLWPWGVSAKIAARSVISMAAMKRSMAPPSPKRLPANRGAGRGEIVPRLDARDGGVDLAASRR